MSSQAWGSEQYVMGRFKSFYSTGAARVDPPTELKRREFGFLSFGGKSMFRHIGFDDTPELRKYMQDYSPAHSYFSAAYYENPRAPMSSKGWLGADLVFDIDADHFVLPCQKVHDRWTCRTCGREGMGHPPDLCPGCGKSTYVEENWLCEECLNAAKYEAQKLLDILIRDLGFSPSNELSVNFSGNRGYHVHVRSPSVKDLNQMSRRELVDYILGLGLEVEFQGFTSRPVGGGSTLQESGWRMRSAQAIYDFVSDLDEGSASSLNMGKKAFQKLLEDRDAILEVLMESHPSGVLRYVSKKTLDALMEAAVGRQASAIDTVVTTDLRRLIRLPNTLHGKTGWLTQNVPIDDLPDYDPLVASIAFKEGTVRIYIRRTPEISVAGEVYGPFEEEEVELPMAVALFILCRKAGRVAR